MAKQSRQRSAQSDRIKAAPYAADDLPAESARIADKDTSSASPDGSTRSAKDFLYQNFSESELVLGLVAAVGTDLKSVIGTIEDRLKIFGYTTIVIKISKDVIPRVAKIKPLNEGSAGYVRTDALMTAGDDARKLSDDSSILALGVAARIASDRNYEGSDITQGLKPKFAYIVDSLKHPSEVTRLREIYPESFYLVGVHADENRRREVLTEEKRMTEDEATRLMQRDEDEQLSYGQRTSDTFHMSDFFVRFDESADKLKQDLWRFLDIIFGNPYITPLFDEFAMFMAFSAALRSADLSRQVGAVLAKNEELLSTGANDCPRFGGGLYWPYYDAPSRRYADVPGGRDYTLGVDSNKAEQQDIIESILKDSSNHVKDLDAFRAVLRSSRIGDLTEYGRVVHAEMEAMLSCARNNISCRDATLYGTTFPCHNCAKHIIAAGIKRVVYVEPYPKSKAVDFHRDSLVLGFSEREQAVRFEPFVGVGPRRFFDLFSMGLSSGYPVVRKDKRTGKVIDWKPETARLRLQLMPLSYLQLETLAGSLFTDFLIEKEGTDGQPK
ncbi:anti-phage dCTP deaminase [Tautonia plasticadhaerens]|uniref:CMP/dCMP-type deaminase domain-containing protein n=1 Tax=Tautonia plasticadhaerens TaxID=2527974 RepID=A0A518H298_9BACT|nr:anti-phage dCTP deaminase [Tautonia plasticadhaerens]QDV34971.1 hypothetical protein ElP_28680 [Tautonia plasticadhaerens]